MVKLYFDSNIPNHIIYMIEHYQFETSSLQECDFIISCKFYASTTNTLKKIQDNLNSYINIGKRVIVFLICDFADDFHIPNNVILFRTSIYKSHKKYNDFLLPYIWENFLHRPLTILPVTNKPIIGFCGRVDKYREKIIKMMQQDNKLNCNFILKTQYWGGEPHNKTLINDFIKNIEDSHFTICNRGNGNYAMRFYQTLSLGRIPVLVDYDHIFPFENEINWNNYIIIGKNEQDVINKIKIWWKNKNILEIQKNCKELFEKYFSNKVFLKKIIDGMYDENNSDNKFIFPIDFDTNIYSKYRDLHNLDYNHLIHHYITKGKHENRIYKLPLNFNVNNYRILNPDLKNFGYNQLIEHYVNKGIYENRKY